MIGTNKLTLTHSKWTFQLAGFWLFTLAAAYYLGSSKSPAPPTVAASSKPVAQRLESRSASSLSHSSKGSSSKRITPSTPTRTPAATTYAKSPSEVAEINNITDPLERSRRMIRYIELLSESDFSAVVDNFQATGMTIERESEYMMLLHAWGKVAPLEALAHSTENSLGRFASQEILASWASNDANAALNWARKNHQGTEANPFLVGVVKGLVGSNPILATQVLQELPYSKERGEALRELIPYISQWGIQRADQWLATIEDPQLLAGAANQLASRFAKQDPSSAAQWARSLEQADARTRAMNEVVQTWTRQSPDEAQSWIETLSDEDSLSAGPEFVNSLAEQDATAAADWLDLQVDSSNYQQLLQKFAQGATQSDPILALNYGNELEDNNARSRTVGRALWTLYKQDKSSARNWIQTNELPERVARYVDKMLED